jgi:hypothetical protein
MTDIEALQKTKLAALRLGAVLLLPAMSLSLMACGDATEEVGAGGLSPQDAEALDEAAAKLDAENAAVPNVTPLQNASTPAQTIVEKTAAEKPAAEKLESKPTTQPAPQKPDAAAPTN